MSTRTMQEELRFTRAVLRDLVTVVGKMKVPQTMAEAAMQVTFEIGPAYLAAKGLLEEKPHYDSL